MIDRGIPRSHYPIFKGAKQIGEVTSGTHSPTLKRNIGLALIDIEHAFLGERLEVEIRGKRVIAETIKTPFYKRMKGKVTQI
jgi:aminomethyltransferase